jgi:hypothetical protein
MSSSKISIHSVKYETFNPSIFGKNVYTVSKNTNKHNGRNIYENYNNSMTHIGIQTEILKVSKTYDSSTNTVKFVLDEKLHSNTIEMLLERRNHFLDFIVENQVNLLKTDKLTKEYLDESDIFRGCLYKLPEDKYLLSVKVVGRDSDENSFSYIQCYDGETESSIEFEPSLLERGQNVQLVLECSGGYVGGGKIYERCNIIAVKLFSKEENTYDIQNILRREYATWKPEFNNFEQENIEYLKSEEYEEKEDDTKSDSSNEDDTKSDSSNEEKEIVEPQVVVEEQKSNGRRKINPIRKK